LLLLWIGKSEEDHFLDTMPMIGFLKTYFKRRLDVTNIIHNNLKILIKSRLLKCTLVGKLGIILGSQL